ncbi:hypothetical protein WUBG_01213 [Wuchereria bancrofti]|nr:hypothetical protein WUBG_01213 [Wuchereria bancrofti]
MAELENEKMEPSICIAICQILNWPDIRMISVCTSQYDQKILSVATSVLFQSQRFCFTNDHLMWSKKSLFASELHRIKSILAKVELGYLANLRTSYQGPLTSRIEQRNGAIAE